jgi:RNA polymerase sigma-70 factor (ECF subfamily)
VAENTLFAVSDPNSVIELDEMRRALAALETEQREAVLLIGAGGLRYSEAAEVCGAKIGTMKSRASRGRARLQEILEAGDYEADGHPCGDAMAMIFAQIDHIRGRATPVY